MLIKTTIKSHKVNKQNINKKEKQTPFNKKHLYRDNFGLKQQLIKIYSRISI